ncbi:MAG: alpha/beta hydrolase-fold protein [Comamonas sp.]
MPDLSASSPYFPSRRDWLTGALAAPALALAGCATQTGSTASMPASANATQWQPWSMPGVRSFDLPAAPLPGSSAPRQHRVMVYVPQGAAPVGGWPVMYVLDGNLMFPFIAQLVHNRSARGPELRSGSAIVVGLGHALPADNGEVHDRSARTYDYTLPYDGVGPDSQGRAQGGADVFLDFIAQQLQPLLQAALPVNAQRQTLVGHSYGGLCTLHALFTRPGMFQRHVAASPSLWWGDGVVVQECQRFIARFGNQPGQPGPEPAQRLEPAPEPGQRRVGRPPPRQPPGQPGARSRCPGRTRPGPGQHGRSACGPGGGDGPGMQLPSLARRQPWRHPAVRLHAGRTGRNGLGITPRR